MARPDAKRMRFRRPLGVAVLAYKAVLGVCEVIVGVLLAIPSFDPQATFARLSAEELREDPGDHFVALVTRHLPSLFHHRGPVAVGLILLGLAKLVAAAAMWEGREWAATCWSFCSCSFVAGSRVGHSAAEPPTRNRPRCQPPGP